MQYFIYSEDRDDGAPIRAENRTAHIAWLKSENATVKVLAAGPWMDDEGNMRGSLLIVEAADKDTLIAWTQSDPYAQARLSKAVTIKPFKWVIGAPETA